MFPFIIIATEAIQVRDTQGPKVLVITFIVQQFSSKDV